MSLSTLCVQFVYRVCRKVCRSSVKLPCIRENGSHCARRRCWEGTSPYPSYPCAGHAASVAQLAGSRASPGLAVALDHRARQMSFRVELAEGKMKLLIPMHASAIATGRGVGASTWSYAERAGRAGGVCRANGRGDGPVRSMTRSCSAGCWRRRTRSTASPRLGSLSSTTGGSLSCRPGPPGSSGSPRPTTATTAAKITRAPQLPFER